jgi:hypothetical protein
MTINVEAHHMLRSSSVAAASSHCRSTVYSEKSNLSDRTGNDSIRYAVCKSITPSGAPVKKHAISNATCVERPQRKVNEMPIHMSAGQDEGYVHAFARNAFAAGIYASFWVLFC